jgi:hypothetical protein
MLIKLDAPLSEVVNVVLICKRFLLAGGDTTHPLVYITGLSPKGGKILSTFFYKMNPFECHIIGWQVI